MKLEEKENFVTVMFSTSTDEKEGFPIIFNAGRVIYTKMDKTYIVPDSTAVTLRSSNINFVIKVREKEKK